MNAADSRTLGGSGDETALFAPAAPSPDRRSAVSWQPRRLLPHDPASEPARVSSLSVAHLKCPNCGASLRVDSKIDTLECEYCGARSKVERTGGQATLHAFADAVAKLQRGADRSAAEMALQRLKPELAAAESRLRDHLRSAELTLTGYEQQALATGARVLRDFVIALVVGFITFVVTIMSAALIHMQFEPNTEPAAVGWRVLYWSISLAVGLLVTVLLIARFTVRRRRRRASIDQERVSVQQRLEKQTRELDAEVKSLQKRIQENRAVVDA